MADGTEFEIQIAADGSSAASAAEAVRLLGDQTERASAASIAAANAVKAAESSYKASEIAADRAAKAHERISLAVNAQAAKVAAVAAEHGMFSAAAQRASDKLAQLTARQSEAAAKSAAASSALTQEAAALDKLKSAATDAAAKQANLSKSLEQAKKSAAHVAEIDAAAKGTGNLGKLSGALGQLGGPLGSIGNKATGAADAIADLSETVGAAGPYLALAIAIVAITTAMIGATVAATVWLVKMGGGMKRVDAISEKFSKHVDGLFQGPKLQGGMNALLDGLEKLADMFDSTSVTGQAMQTVIEDLGGGLLSFVSTLIPKVIAGFIQLQIWILKALIFIKPYGSEIMFVVEALAVFAGVVMGVVVVAVGLLVAAFVAGVAITRLLAEAIVWVGAKAVEIGTSIYNFFASLSLASIGSALIDGLIAGITSAGPNVLSAITGIAGGAIDAAKKALGIASPSKVFAEIGTNTAEGMAIGVESGTGDVQGSMVSMISPPDAQPAAEPSTTSGGGGGTYHITIQAAPGSTVDAYMQLIRETLTDLVEGDVTQLAGAVPAR